MSDLGGTIAAGDSESWKVRVGDTLGLTIGATAAPYEIDIETKHRNETDSAYSRIQPLTDFATITVTDTADHTYETNQIEGVVRITVTNNAGTKLTVDGSVSTGTDEYFLTDSKRWINADQTIIERVYTKSTESTVRVWRDGGIFVADGETGTISRGSDAETVLSAAVDSLPTSGGRIHIRTATYDGIDATIDDIPKATHIEGDAMSNPQLRSDGSFAGYILETTSDTDYQVFEDFSIHGMGSAAGIHALNPGTGAGGSSVAHTLVKNMVIASCTTGVYFDATENARYLGGRMDNCDVGITWEAPGGIGLLGQLATISNHNTTGVEVNTAHMEIVNTSFGSTDATQHIKLTGDLTRLTIAGCWFENGPTVLDLNGHSLDRLIINGTITAVVNGGSAVIDDLAGGGSINELAILGNVNLNRSSGSAGTCNFLGVNPSFLWGWEPNFGANCAWNHKGFRNSIIPAAGAGAMQQFKFGIELSAINAGTEPPNLGQGRTWYHNGIGDGEEGLGYTDGTNRFYNNGIAETAAAHTPQGTYMPAQVVFFTDSIDGTGSGMYLIDQNGTPQGPV